MLLVVSTLQLDPCVCSYLVHAASVYTVFSYFICVKQYPLSPDADCYHMLHPLSHNDCLGQCSPLFQVLHHLRHLIPASQKLTHLLVSQACLQASPVPQLTRPPWGGGQAFSPAAKGELLMAAVMAMAQPSQHTQGSATLLNALLSSFGLAAAAQSAIAKVSKPCFFGCYVMSAQFCGTCVMKWHSWWLSPGPPLLEVLLICLAVSLAASTLKCKGRSK